MVPIPKFVAVAVATALVTAACSASVGGETGITSPTDPTDPTTEDAPEAPTTTRGAETNEETTTTTSARTAEIPAEPPPWETIALTTADGVELHGKYWAGGPTAVIFSHEYDAAQAGSTGQRPPQSSDTLLTWIAVIAAEGHTVLSIDWRGHGQSGGEYNVKESQIDLKTAYAFLESQGYGRIIMLALGGSGPVATDLAAKDPAVSFDGLGLLWSPPQETGFDATRALSEIEASVWIVGIDTPRQARWPKLLERNVENLYETFIFPRVPTGLQFIDVYGEEFAGRLLDFVEKA